MSDGDNAEFAKRLKRIEKSQKKFARIKHNPKEHGSVPRSSSNKKKKRTSVSTWIVRAVLAYVMFVGVKSFLAYEMGPEAYNTRISELAEGDRPSQAMAFVMGSGPLMNMFTTMFGGISSTPAEDAPEPGTLGAQQAEDAAAAAAATQTESAAQ